MAKICIAVADSSRARLFHSDAPHTPWVEVQDFTCPAARHRESGLITDSPGQTFDHSGGGQHGLTPRVSQKEEEAILFAKHVTEALVSSHHKGDYQELILIAAPHFLGLVRKALPETLRRCVIEEVNKDVVTFTPERIRETLPERYTLNKNLPLGENTYRPKGT